TRTRRPPHEGVVALPCHTQHAAQRSDGKAGLLRSDERELYSFSFAKKAAAFFRMSRSIFSDSFSRRSAVFSRSSLVSFSLLLSSAGPGRAAAFLRFLAIRSTLYQ